MNINRLLDVPYWDNLEDIVKEKLNGKLLLIKNLPTKLDMGVIADIRCMVMEEETFLLRDQVEIGQYGANHYWSHREIMEYFEKYPQGFQVSLAGQISVRLTKHFDLTEEEKETLKIVLFYDERNLNKLYTILSFIFARRWEINSIEDLSPIMYLFPPQN